MSNQTALVKHRREDVGILPTSDTLESMLRMAGELHKSGLLPSHIKSPQAAFAVIQKGLELGVPPMYSMSNIIVINGKPSANAELMLALIYRDQGDNAIIFDESTSQRCTVNYKRKGWPSFKQFAFTIEEAKAAGLLTNNTWQKYPKAMLRARCISAVARLAFPDSIGGMYTPEELGASVSVSDDDEITVIEPEQPATVHAFPQQQPSLEAEAVSQTIAETTIQAIRSIAARKGIDIDAQLKKQGMPTLGFLTVTEADKITRWLDGKPDAEPATEPPALTEAPQGNGAEWVCGEELKRSIIDMEAALEEFGLCKKARDKMEVTYGTRNPSKLTVSEAASYKGYLIDTERKAREQQNQSNPLI